MLEPVICIAKVCNHKCIFCSRYKEGDIRTSPSNIKKIVSTFKNSSLNIEGGEPMLASDLIKWVKFAKSKGVKEVILVTNGYGLDNENKVKEFIKAGFDVFNINFPSHIPQVYEILTGNKNTYSKTINAISTIIKKGAKLRLTYVINKINYKFLESYAIFVKKNFPEVF